MNISIDICINDAISRLSPQSFEFGDGVVQTNSSLSQCECKIFVWPQTWNDLSCGFGDMCGQAIAETLSVVVIGPMQDACVYHDGKLAYKLDEVGEEFWKCIDNRELPGKMDSKEMSLCAKGEVK